MLKCGLSSLENVRGRGSVLVLAIMLLGAYGLAGSINAAGESEPRSSFVGSVFTNENSVMVIQEDKAVVHNLDGVGIKSSSVNWVVETYVGGNWSVLDWISRPHKTVRDIGEFHEVLSKGTLENDIELTVSYLGLHKGAPDAGLKVTATVKNREQPSYLRVGWMVEGVTLPFAQLEVRLGEVRTPVVKVSDQEVFQRRIRADGLANSMLFLNGDDSPSFGVNWEDALMLHDETILASRMVQIYSCQSTSAHFSSEPARLW